MEKYVNYNFVNKRMERKNSYLLIICIVAFVYLAFINFVTKVPESIPDLILEHGKVCFFLKKKKNNIFNKKTDRNR